MFSIFFLEISGMFPTVSTFPEKFASLGMRYCSSVCAIAYWYARLRKGMRDCASVCAIAHWLALLFMGTHDCTYEHASSCVNMFVQWLLIILQIV